MDYAVLEEVKVTRGHEGRVIVWRVLDDLGNQLIAIAVHNNVEEAHTFLANGGYQPNPYEAPSSELQGLYEYYYRLIPVVLL